jgi:hypothetical protein
MTDSIDQKQPVVVTRDDLYRQVWEKRQYRRIGCGPSSGLTGLQQARPEIPGYQGK